MMILIVCWTAYRKTICIISGRFRNMINFAPALTGADSWSMGTCLPRAVIGLANRHKYIRSLSLTTDGSCSYPRYDPQAHSGLKCLRTFSWRGLRSQYDFEVLRDILEANNEHLEDLALELVDWNRAGRLYSPPLLPPNNFSATNVLNMRNGQPGSSFPSLTSLSLSHVSFESVSSEIVCALNMDQLRSLKLRYCPDEWILLEQIMSSGCSIRLTSLELVIQLRPYFDDEAEILTRFLASFETLVDLFLSLPECEGWDGISESLYRSHQPNLRRLIIHDRVLFDDDDGDYFECDGSLEENAKFMMSLLRSSNLECIGITYHPPDMVRNFSIRKDPPLAFLFCSRFDAYRVSLCR